VGDELLHDGVYGHGDVWKFACRQLSRGETALHTRCSSGALVAFPARCGLRPRCRNFVTTPIYVKIGILPEVAQGIQQTSELSVPPES